MRKVAKRNLAAVFSLDNASFQQSTAVVNVQKSIFGSGVQPTSGLALPLLVNSFFCSADHFKPASDFSQWHGMVLSFC